MGELQRLASHLCAVGFFLNDCGAFQTPVVYMLREREKILDLFDMVCGQRLTYNYMRVGGVSQDLPDEFIPALKKLLAEMPGWIGEYERLLKQNEILLARAKGVGILSKEQAINSSASGPVLRASGVEWDIRRADPYSIYDRFEFDIPTGSAGDCYDRYRVRIAEMHQSLRILEQAAAQLPPGEWRAEVPHLVRPPAGEAYGRLESPKGELGFYLVSDGSIAPYRFHVRAPTFINLTTLGELVRGWKIADAILIFGSIDICMGEVDR
jgi:NADH-quinone oxidoreductase subunit D